MVTFDVDSLVDADDENSTHADVNDDNNDRDHAANTPHAKSTVFVKQWLFSSFSLHSYATHPEDLKLQKAKHQFSGEHHVFCL